MRMKEFMRRRYRASVFSMEISRDENARGQGRLLVGHQSSFIWALKLGGGFEGVGCQFLVVYTDEPVTVSGSRINIFHNTSHINVEPTRRICVLTASMNEIGVRRAVHVRVRVWVKVTYTSNGVSTIVLPQPDST